MILPNVFCDPVCKNIQNNFYIYTNPLSFPALLKISDVFLRPTNSDGDALSIREAIDLKVPVVASDCVIRPNGVALFKSRDLVDFFNVTTQVLRSYEYYKTQSKHYTVENNSQQILNVYNKTIHRH